MYKLGVLNSGPESIHERTPRRRRSHHSRVDARSGGRLLRVLRSRGVRRQSALAELLLPPQPGAALRERVERPHRRRQPVGSRSLIEQKRMSGLLAYLDGQPVAWCCVGPREAMTTLAPLPDENASQI